MKTVVYCRVSSELQRDEGYSLQNQRDRLLSYCSYNELGTPIIISDEGISGKTQRLRPGFQTLLSMIEKKEVDAIVVYSLSRLGRNTVETLQFIDTLNKKGITLHSLSEKLDTASAMGKFFLTVLTALCELESGQLGERVSSVLQNKKSSQKTYCKRITGFINREGVLEVNEPEMEIVRQIFAWRKEGKSPYAISKLLNSQKKTTTTGKKFLSVGVAKILSNNIYKGYL